MSRPIVFIHGSGDSARIWRLQVEQSGEDAEMYALDLPGHGERPDTLPAEVTVLDYAKAAYSIIVDELRLPRPIIAGHSLGGAVALTIALEYGTELGGLILVGTGARLRVHPALLEEARIKPEEASSHMGELAVTPAHASTLPQAIRSEQVPPGGHIFYRDLAACNIFDCMARLNEISLPTLIICGADDRLTPVKYSQFLSEHISGSTLRVIPGAGHYVMREQPEEVHAAIEEWLQRL